MMSGQEAALCFKSCRTLPIRALGVEMIRRVDGLRILCRVNVLVAASMDMKNTFW